MSLRSTFIRILMLVGFIVRSSAALSATADLTSTSVMAFHSGSLRSANVRNQPSTEPAGQKVAIAFYGSIGQRAKSAAELIKSNGCTATFFVMGKQLEQPENQTIVRDIAALGHEIGNGSYVYGAPGTHPTEEIYAPDLANTSNIIRSLVGRKPTVAFEPWNATGHLEFLQACDRCSLSDVTIGIRLHDYAMDARKDQIVNEVFTHLRGQRIVGFSLATDESLGALPLVLAQLRLRGYTCVQIHDLLEAAIAEPQQENAMEALTPALPLAELKKADTFQDLVTRGSPNLRRVLYAQVRRLSEALPTDESLQRMALRTYIDEDLELCDGMGAQRQAARMQQSGFLLGIGDRYDVARLSGNMQALLPELLAGSQASDPKHLIYPFVLGHAYRDIGETTNALAAFRVAAARTSGMKSVQSQLRLQAIEQQVELGDIAAASSELASIFPLLDPSTPASSWLIVARIYQQFGQRSQARSAMERYAKGPNFDPAESTRYRIQDLFETGHFDRCIAELERALGDPKLSWNLQQHYKLLHVWSLSLAGKTQQAQQLASQILESLGSVNTYDRAVAEFVIKRAVGDQVGARAAAGQLGQRMQTLSSISPYARLDPDVGLELLVACHEYGLDEIAKPLADLLAIQTFDVPLPRFQWMLAAIQQSHDKAAAVKHGQLATRLDPENWWYIHRSPVHN